MNRDFKNLSFDSRSFAMIPHSHCVSQTIRQLNLKIIIVVSLTVMCSTVHCQCDHVTMPTPNSPVPNLTHCHPTPYVDCRVTHDRIRDTWLMITIISRYRDSVIIDISQDNHTKMHHDNCQSEEYRMQTSHT